jgi:hypothetical protein
MNFFSSERDTSPPYVSRMDGAAKSRTGGQDTELSELVESSAYRSRIGRQALSS